MNVPPVRMPSPEELQLISKYRDKMDCFHTYTLENGELVIKVDDIKEQFVDLASIIDIDFFDFDDDEPLPFDDENETGISGFQDEQLLPYDDADQSGVPCSEDKALAFASVETLRDNKLYGKEEIKKLLQCGNQKALNFLKLLFQMHYAIKIGKSYLIKAEDFDRFFEDYKGQEIMI